MELTMNRGFCELSLNELEMVEGGSSNGKKVAFYTLGGVLIANSLAIGVVNPAAGITAFGTGLYLMGCA